MRFMMTAPGQWRTEWYDAEGHYRATLPAPLLAAWQAYQLCRAGQPIAGSEFARLAVPGRW